MVFTVTKSSLNHIIGAMTLAFLTVTPTRFFREHEERGALTKLLTHSERFSLFSGVFVAETTLSYQCNAL